LVWFGPIPFYSIYSLSLSFIPAYTRSSDLTIRRKPLEPGSLCSWSPHHITQGRGHSRLAGQGSNCRSRNFLISISPPKKKSFLHPCHCIMLNAHSVYTVQSSSTRLYMHLLYTHSKYRFDISGRCHYLPRATSISPLLHPVGTSSAYSSISFVALICRIPRFPTALYRPSRKTPPVQLARSTVCTLVRSIISREKTPYEILQRSGTPPHAVKERICAKEEGWDMNQVEDRGPREVACRRPKCEYKARNEIKIECMG